MTEFDNALTHKNDELETGVSNVDKSINELKETVEARFELMTSDITDIKEVNDKQNEILDHQVDINKLTREYLDYLENELENETDHLHKYCTVLSALYVFQFIFLIIMFIWLWVA